MHIHRDTHYTYTHRYTLIQIHSDIDTHSYTQIHIHIHTHTHRFTLVHTDTHSYTQILTSRPNGVQMPRVTGHVGLVHGQNFCRV